eukprot:705216-Pyramimonas_sp.AAC.1
MTGRLHGPQNEDNLNGASPALLSGGLGLNFNSDVQLPYRFPSLEQTRDGDACAERCWDGAE